MDETLPEDSAEVERIIADKKKDKGNMYLIKWKDLPESENSWIPERYFNSMKLVNEYWQKKESEKPRKGRKPEKVKSNLLLKTMICLCFVVAPVLGLKVSDEFKYCETQNPSIFDTKEICLSSDLARSYERKDFLSFVLGKQILSDSLPDPADREKMASTIRNRTLLHIYSKRSHMVYGTGTRMLDHKIHN